MKRVQLAIVLAVAFGAGAFADWEYRALRAPKGPYARMSHVGILVPDLDEAVRTWRAMGFTGIDVSPPSKGIDRRYHDAPLDCELRQAFIAGIPPIELLAPACDRPNPWSGELRERGTVLHHIAYDVDDPAVHLQQLGRAGFVEIAAGKWQDARQELGMFHYVRPPESALIIELMSRVRPG